MRTLQRRLVRVAATAAVVGWGAVLVGPQSAQASLIGDSIGISTGIPTTTCNLATDCPHTRTVIDPGAELQNGDGSLFAGAIDPFNVTGSVDVFAERIEIIINAGGVFTFLFSGLQWLDAGVPVAGTLNDVTLDPGGNALTNFSFDELVNDAILGASFRTVLSCTTMALGGSCVPGTAWILNLDVTHPPVSAVPLPAALPLFLSALAGLGLVGWRRKKAAT